MKRLAELFEKADLEQIIEIAHNFPNDSCSIDEQFILNKLSKIFK
jgi:hypothetical protein